jgi:hypothetical protein
LSVTSDFGAKPCFLRSSGQPGYRADSEPACRGPRLHGRRHATGTSVRRQSGLPSHPDASGRSVDSGRQFETLVERHAGDAYVKSFTSWNYLLALVYAQFSSAVSLRGLEAGWNANREHHYRLGSGPLVRSTLADANKRRPVAVFAETFSLVASQLDRQARRDGMEMVKLIDATPIPLGNSSPPSMRLLPRSSGSACRRSFVLPSPWAAKAAASQPRAPS